MSDPNMDLSGFSVYGLVHKLGADPLLDARIDQKICYDIKTYADISYHTYWFSERKIKFLPMTVAKINMLIREEISVCDYYTPMKSIQKWFDTDTKNIMMRLWLNDNDVSYTDSWIVEDANIYKSSLRFTILVKLIGIYKSSKSQKNLANIQTIFSTIDKDYIKQACEVIASSSPAVQLILLSKMDIGEDFILKGLKALSKLNRQRQIDINIDLKMLGKLGPKSRLTAMKQLFGMNTKYYQYKQKQKEEPDNYYYKNRWREGRLKNKAILVESLPFKITPTKEEIEEFLFPCVMLYHQEVVSIMERFDELVVKEKMNGKSI